MIKLENFEVMGWEHAIRGMRNPMNSWDKSDSETCVEYHNNHGCDTCRYQDEACEKLGRKSLVSIGPNDHNLMMKLAKGGSVHAKYRRMITVYVDITAPLYWWKEFDTYKVGTVANSCSTMHKIHEKEFTLDDFSCEHLINITKPTKELIDNDCVAFEESGFGNTLYWTAMNILELTIEALNTYRQRYLETNDKKYWWQMIQLLPSSYNQKRTVMLNYEVLTNIYKWRKNHKLDEWVEFCKWIESLPYSEIITGKTDDDVRSMKLSEAIDVIFPHNYRVAIWTPCKEEHYSMLVWSGMAHELPKKFLDSKNWMIKGFMAEDINDSDRINIEVCDVGVDQAVIER